MSTKPIRSASHRLTNNVVFKVICDSVGTDGKVLDFGSGAGHMCQRLGNYFEEAGRNPADHIYACEINPSEFLYDKIKCKKISPDSDIPFPDNHFDLICSIEVIEHTRRPYDLFCEAYKRLKPDGTFLWTTPNLLHMKSRLEFLFTGFGDMYPPPSSLEKNAGRICGHIMPLNLATSPMARARLALANLSFIWIGENGVPLSGLSSFGHCLKWPLGITTVKFIIMIWMIGRKIVTSSARRIRLIYQLPAAVFLLFASLRMIDYYDRYTRHW